MEILLIVIENLKAKRRKLLLEKEKNIENIRQCETKISYYKYLYGYFNFMKRAKKQSLETYSKITEYGEDHGSLFDFLGPKHDSYAKRQIPKCKEEIDSLNDNMLKIKKWFKYYLERLNTLKLRNEEIEQKIAEIDLELSRLQEEGTYNNDQENKPKVYKLERGDKND